MTYRSTKKFNRQLAGLKPAEQQRCLKRIAQFKTNPAHPLLRVHMLTGKYGGHHSISAGGDLRIIFFREENYTVFVAIGSHSQLYG